MTCLCCCGRWLWKFTRSPLCGLAPATTLLFPSPLAGLEDAWPKPIPSTSEESLTCLLLAVLSKEELMSPRLSPSAVGHALPSSSAFPDSSPTSSPRSLLSLSSHSSLIRFWVSGFPLLSHVSINSSTPCRLGSLFSSSSCATRRAIVGGRTSSQSHGVEPVGGSVTARVEREIG